MLAAMGGWGGGLLRVPNGSLCCFCMCVNFFNLAKKKKKAFSTDLHGSSKAEIRFSVHLRYHGGWVQRQEANAMRGALTSKEGKNTAQHQLWENCCRTPSRQSSISTSVTLSMAHKYLTSDKTTYMLNIKRKLYIIGAAELSSAPFNHCCAPQLSTFTA